MTTHTHKDNMKRLQDIASFFTTTHGALTAVIGIIAIGSSYLLRHDAAVIKKYNDNNEIKKEYKVDPKISNQISAILTTIPIVVSKTEVINDEKEEDKP